MALSSEKLEHIMKPEMRAKFDANKNQWLAWNKWSGRTPGLFKLKCVDQRMIALCSKCYFVEEEEDPSSGTRKNKQSTKGMSKVQNTVTWERFKAALDGGKDMASNKGFRMVGGRMMTYEQQKLGLSGY